MPSSDCPASMTDSSAHFRRIRWPQLASLARTQFLCYITRICSGARVSRLFRSPLGFSLSSIAYTVPPIQEKQIFSYFHDIGGVYVREHV